MGENDPHVAGLDGDAAGRGGALGGAQMEEDGAAAALAPGPDIVVENDDDIVEMVDAPEFLVGGGIGQANGPVVVAVAGLVAPAVAAGEGGHGKGRRRRQGTVAAEQHPAQAPEAQWCAAIALAFPGGDAASAKEAGKNEAARLQTAMAARRRDRANVKSCDDFPHGELSCEGPCGAAWSN